MVRRAALGGVLLAALALEVRALPQAVFLESEIEPAQVHVQAQAVYRLRFYQGVDVQDLKITGPSAALADILPIGSGRTYESVRDGRRYRVHERSYAVFPFASGPLKLGGAQAAGRVPGDGAAGPDGRRPVRLDAPPRTLAVLPLPDDVAFAARSLALTETWPAAAEGEIKVGEALRRVVRLEAAGVDAATLPEVEIRGPGLTVHPEPPRLENRFQGDIRMAIREQAFRLVPQRSGVLTVPDVRIPWLDAGRGEVAVATLPSRSLKVIADGASPVQATPPADPAPAGQAPANLPGLLGVPIGLLAAALAAWTGRRRWHGAWQLHRACRSGNPGEVRNGVLGWAAARWPEDPPRSLEALAGRVADPETRRILGELERRLYGPGDGEWDSRSLAALPRRLRRSSP